MPHQQTHLMGIDSYPFHFALLVQLPWGIAFLSHAFGKKKFRNRLPPFTCGT
jgi:hypothetical protein